MLMVFICQWLFKLFEALYDIEAYIDQIRSKSNDTLNKMTGGRANYVWNALACYVAYVCFKITVVVVVFCYQHTITAITTGFFIGLATLLGCLCSTFLLVEMHYLGRRGAQR